MDTLLHTPDGVRDIYGHECAMKDLIEENVLRTLKSFGYDRIETPTFEFFDIFNQERGSVSSREMYKFFDRDNNTLVLRPDITPAIARCVTKFFREETQPVRLCYLGNTFLNSVNYTGRLKEISQSGAELIGDSTADADTEMVLMTVECLKAAGLTDFHVEIGEVGFYRGIVEAAGLTEEEDRELRELIENKNSFGVEEFAEAHVEDEKIRTSFIRLPMLFGGIGEISAARELTDSPRALAAIERLEKIAEIIEIYGLTDYVSFDLGMLSQYEYYTGMIFKAYSYGTGDYLVNGGRYDRLISQFGTDRSAVGFAVRIDSVLSCIMSQKITLPVDETGALVVYRKRHTARAVALIRKMRGEGKRVAAQLWDERVSDEEYRAYAERNGIRELILMKED